MTVNGIVVQEYSDNSYRGIDGSGFSEKSAQNWFLNYVCKYTEKNAIHQQFDTFF